MIRAARRARITPAQAGSGIVIAATAPVGWATGMGADANNFSRLASYSNYGTSAVHVSAPGGDFAYPGNENCKFNGVVVPCWVLDMSLSTSRGSGASNTTHTWAAGTCMSAPAASAVAAIIKHRNPGISLGALKTKLAQTADDINKPGAGPETGKGWVNAARVQRQLSTRNSPLHLGGGNAPDFFGTNPGRPATLAKKRPPSLLAGA